MRWPHWLLVAFLILPPQLFAQRDGPTLAEALQQDHVPTAGLPVAALRERITSFATFHDTKRFLIGYYIRHGDLLNAPLWVRDYDKRQNAWHSQAIRGAQAAIVGSINAECLGSVLAIKTIGTYIAIETHINPSAGCVLLLDSQLRLKRALSGWVIGFFSSGEIILEHSQIHFAPTHPLQLEVYDPHNDAVSVIFPPKHDRLRDDFMNDLRDNLSPEYCREANASCNPEDVDTSAEGFEFNEVTQSFAFLVHFGPIGFGPKAERVVGDRSVLYVFRHRGSAWEYREFLADKSAPSPKEAVSAPSIRLIFADQ